VTLCRVAIIYIYALIHSALILHTLRMNGMEILIITYIKHKSL
jgi:hypothetical protein